MPDLAPWPRARRHPRVVRLDDLADDDAVLAELGRRLEARRLAANVTQSDLAQRAGVGLRTLKRLEAGEGATAANLMRVLRTLGLLAALEEMLPADPPAPSAPAPARRRASSRARYGG